MKNPRGMAWVWITILFGILALVGASFWMDKQIASAPTQLWSEVATTTNAASNHSDAKSKNAYNLPTSPIGDVGRSSCYWQMENSVVFYSPTTTVSEIVTVPGADVRSFKDLTTPFTGGCFGKDDTRVYLYDQVLSWADPQTFDILTDRNTLIGNGNKIVSWKLGYLPDNTYITTLSSNCSPGISAGFCIVPNSDAGTFQVIDTGTDKPAWSKDKNNVYCLNQVIPGADPSTTQIIDPFHLRVMVHGTPWTYGGDINPCVGASSSAQ